MARARTALFALALVACGTRASEAPREHVASDADFLHFDHWIAFDRGPDSVPPIHPGGVSTVYLSARPPQGAREFPVGTTIVRLTRGPDATHWEAHAMVKRGAPYNASGARGWEFFELHLDLGDDGIRVPHIQWRGESPPMGDGYTAPQGGALLSCNHCHSTADANDFVLGPELDLRTF
ncbi:hypothetical protein [Sandaracinus amylolyticus]|uniref:hypothetical protein n=1 Tax=Sandaracinus amylolyticus TaxID=927083 RepID=UPI001F2A4B76|nr:hypothetical protein [Sandaracinus amylolyticus]UJR80028.1 Hypothetical protein I5071_20720 [Sandaracinus amylolyticus]